MTLVLSSCLLLVFSHVPQALTDTVDNNQPIYTDIYPKLSDDVDSYNYQQPISSGTIAKRAPSVSINQDLVSLAKLLRSEANRRRFKSVSKSLEGLGKRSQPEMFESLQGIPSPLIAGDLNEDKRTDSSDVFHRSTRRYE